MGDLWQGITGQKLDSALAGSIEFSRAVVDSRLAVGGSIFFALAGEKGDGHDYVADAFQRGAKVAIVSRKVGAGQATIAVKRDAASAVSTIGQGNFCILVSDTLRALQDLSAHWRRKFSVRVIGITGSTGKTSTKETIYTVLSRTFHTLKSPGNYNNEIGLPLALLELDGTQDKAILEMGMYGLGEIKRLAEIALPEVGVVTNVGPSHLERLGTLGAIAKAKSELVASLPADGVAILNGDDPRARAMAKKAKARVLLFGLAEDCDFRASDIESRGLEGVSFRLHYGDESFYLKIPLLGQHSVHTALAAVAVGVVEGQPWEEILRGVQEGSVQLRLLTYPGINGSLVIDDTYNASPDSVLAALNLLADLEGRKIAVLGDMLELGSMEEQGHKIVGRRAAEAVDLLITVGPLARIMAEEARLMGLEKVVAVDTNQQALEALNQSLKQGDVVLVKASRAMKMEEIVSEIIRR